MWVLCALVDTCFRCRCRRCHWQQHYCPPLPPLSLFNLLSGFSIFLLVRFLCQCETAVLFLSQCQCHCHCKLICACAAVHLVLAGRGGANEKLPLALMLG